MEKATAELDGTIVFNYIDDDIQIVETEVIEKQPTKETKSDTSFDENQNPKAIIPICPIAEKLIKKEKDLIILLENEVLTPIKLEPTEESTSLHPQNSTKDVNKKIRRKKARFYDPTKPPTKKLKTQDTVCKHLITKELKDINKGEKLEESKPKRGRPKKLIPSLKVNKKTIPKIKIKLKKPKLINKGLVNKKVVPKIIIKLKHIPKQTKRGIKAKKQYAVIESYKPKRGRPKKQVTHLTETGYQVSKSIKKKDIQEEAIMEKDVTVDKATKHRSKSLEASVLKSCQTSKAVEHCSAKDITESQLGIVNGPSLEDKSGHATIEFKDLGPPKPKRGRPVGSGRKSLNFSLQSNTVECPEINKSENRSRKQTLTPIDIDKLQPLKVDAFQASKAVEFCPNKELLNTGMKLKQGVTSKELTQSQQQGFTSKDITESQLGVVNGPSLEDKSGHVTIEFKDLGPPKPKRGRPVGSGRKSLNFSLQSNAVECTEINKSENRSRKQTLTPIDIDKLQPLKVDAFQASKAIELCPNKELTQSQHDNVNGPGLEAKSGFATIEFNNLGPPKSKRGRPVGSGRRGLNFSLQSNTIACPKVNELENQDINPKQTYTSLDITKLQSSNAIETPVILNEQAASVRGVWLTKPKKIRSKSLETKKAASIVSNAKESSKSKKLKNSIPEPNELEPLVDLTEPQISIIKELMAQAEQQIAIIKNKPKRGRPKSLGTKKIGVPEVVSKVKKVPKSKKSEKQPVEPRHQVLESIDLIQIQPFEIVESCLQDEQQTASVEPKSLGTEQQKASVKSNILDISKPKPGRPRSLGSKKVDIPLGLKPPKSGVLKNKSASRSLQVSLDLTKSQSSKTEESSVEAGNATVPVNLVPSKPKRSRPKASGIRKVDDSLLSKTARTKELKITGMELKQQPAVVDLTKSLPYNTKETSLEVGQHTRGRPRSLEPKKLGSSELKAKKYANKYVSSTHLDALMDLTKFPLSKISQKNLNIQLQNGLVESNDSVPCKPKRGRPKGFRLKKLIPFANTDPQPSTSQKADIDLVTRQLSSSLVISDVGNNINSSKAFTLKALGLKAKEAISSHLVPSQGRRLRAKGWTPKVTPRPKRTTMELKAPNIDALDMKPDITKLRKNLKTSKGLPKLVVGINKVNIGHPKRKRGRPKGSLNRKINPLALMVRLEPLKLEEIEFAGAGPSTSVKPTCSGLSQSNMFQNKGIEPRKVNASMTEPRHHSTKCKEIIKEGTGAKQQNTREEAIEKGIHLTNAKTKRVSFPETTKSLNVSKGSGEKMQTPSVNLIDLAAPKAKGGQDRAPKARSSLSTDTTKLSKLFKSRDKSLRVTKVDVSNKITSSRPNETAGFDLGAKKNSVVEIVDLQPPNSTVAKVSRAKQAKVIEPQPSTSNGIVETIDLELSACRSNKGQGLGIRKLNFIGNMKGPLPRKAKNITYITEANGNLQPTQNKEASSKRKRRDIIFCEGNKDFIFPKPKRVKRVLATNDKSAKPVEIVEQSQASVGGKDIEPPKSEEIVPKLEEQKDNASVDTKDEPSKLLDLGVQSIPRKIMCTVGTQTIEIPDDDDNKEDAKISVETVGSQILASPKPKDDKDATAASTSESSLAKADKKSDCDEKNEIVDETVKTEDVLIPNILQPTVTINLTEGHQEHGVKFESVEQIHTEFKYESQSEHEDLLRRRRGKLGGPMRGRRRRPKEEPTSINSFVRIIDLNGKIQLKCYNQIFKCDHCLYVGNSKANLDRHSLVHRSPDEIIWFQCTECPYRSKYEHQLKSHFLIHLKPEQIHFYQCPHCEAKCSRKHNLANHIRSIHSSREYTFRCAECDYTTFSKERLVAHIRKHSKEVHACTQCKFVTKRLEYLRAHFKMKHLLNAIPRPFPCDTCSYKGKTKRELDKHFDRMHNKDRLHVYHCNHCTFNSIYKKNLEFHLLHMHNNSEGFQKFICGHCQKTFSYKNGLKVHIIRCHLQLPDDEWHKCQECKYKSKDVSTLKRHIKRNHGAPRLHCKLCGFATNRQVSMDAHVKTHEYDNEDILKCPECPYRILQMSSFLYHMKVIHGKPVTSKDAEQYYMQDEC